MMDIQSILHRIGVGTENSQKVSNKAEEFLRMINMKCSSVLGKADHCRPALAVQLACKSCQLKGFTSSSKIKKSNSCGHGEYDLDSLVKLAAVPPKVFAEAIRITERILGVQSTGLSFEQIAVKLGGNRIVGVAKNILEAFQTSINKTGPIGSPKIIIRPAHTAAIFYLSAKKLKIKLDYKAMLEICNLEHKEFQSAANIVLEHCHTKLGDAGKKVGDRKRKERELKSIKDVQINNDNSINKIVFDNNNNIAEEINSKEGELHEKLMSNITDETARPLKSRKIMGIPDRKFNSGMLKVRRRSVLGSITGNTLLEQEQSTLSKLNNNVNNSKTDTNNNSIGGLLKTTLTQPLKGRAEYEEWKKSILQKGKNRV